MPIPSRSHGPATTLALTLLASSCGGDSSNPTPPEAELQSVVVAVSTTGDDPDADGYTVMMGARSLDVAPSGSVTFEDVAAGSYEVRLTGVAENCEVQGGASRTITVTASSGAQVAFDVVCQRVLDSFTTIACPDLSLARVSGPPLDRVEIGELPSELGETPWARLTWADGDEAVPAFVGSLEGEPSRLMVPLHPSGSPGGGEATIRFTDGTRACPPVEFRIDALAPAPGALSATIDGAKELVTQHAAILGTTPDELEVDDPEDLPRHLLPLAIVHSILSSDELSTFVDGLDPHTREVLDALLGRVGMGDASGAGSPRSSSTAVTNDPLKCSKEDIGSDAAELDRCMIAKENMTEFLPDDVEQRLTKLQQSLVTVALAVGIERTAAAAAVGIVISVYELAWRGGRAMLPTLEDLTVGPWIVNFFSDTKEPGRWFEAELTATSGGPELELSLMSAFGGEDAPEEELALYGFLLARGFSEAEAQGQYANVALSGLVRALAGSEEQPFMMETIGPVDVTDMKWSASEVIDGNSIHMISHQEYEVVRGNSGTSTIEVRTAADAFGGEVARYRMEIEVADVELTLQPSEVWLEPEDVFDFQVSVEAAFPDSIKVIPPEQGHAEVKHHDGAQPTVRYTAPASPNFGQPDNTIFVSHTIAPAFSQAGIGFADLQMAPKAACLEPGGSTFIERTFEGSLFTTIHGDPVFVWDTGGRGSVDDGTFHAPEDTGPVTIRAHIDGHPNLDHEITIRVGDCGSTLALYRYLGTELDFPFSPTECGNGEDWLWEDDTLPGGPFDPLVPPDPSLLLIGRTDAQESSVEETALRGYNTGDGCVEDFFYTRAALDASFTGSSAADRIDVLIDTEAESSCVDFAFGTECSSGSAVAIAFIRFDRQITQAVNYRLKMEMTCNDYLPAGAPVPKIQILIIRAEPDGTLVNPPGDRGGFTVPCGSSNPLAEVDHLMEATPPAEEGQTDALFILVQFTHFTTTFEGHLGPGGGFVYGYISLKEES